MALGKYVELADRNNELGKVEAYLAGHASDAIVICGKKYTPKFIHKFLLYLEIKELIGIDTLSSFIEISPGAGRFVEVVAKLNPKARCYLVDIPPQLYVTQQFLCGAFPGQVATYQMIKNDPLVLENRNYRIFILAPWQLDSVKLEHPDLFVNQGAFEEMLKETVKGYLDYATRWQVQNIHLETIEQKKGYEIASIEDYKRFLPEYDLVSQVSTADQPIARAYLPEDQSQSGLENKPTYSLLFQPNEKG